MPIDGSYGSRQGAAARSSIFQGSAFKAHLRLMPQSPGQYRVVLTFRHGDGQLGEAALTPLEASVLVSEIAYALGEGDRRTFQLEPEQAVK